MLTILCLAASVAATAPPLPTSSPLVEGERVRLLFRPGADPLFRPGQEGWTRTAEVAFGEDGTLLFRFDERKDEPLEVPWPAIAKLERSLGRRSRPQGALRGAGYGLVTGVALGILAGAGSACDDCFFRSRGEAILFGTIVFTAPATTVGAVAGFLFPGERWLALPPQGGRVTWTVGVARPGGAARSTPGSSQRPAFGVSISF